MVIRRDNSNCHTVFTVLFAVAVLGWILLSSVHTLEPVGDTLHSGHNNQEPEIGCKRIPYTAGLHLPPSGMII